MNGPPERPLEDDVLTLDDLRLCFGGAVPAVVATAAADGTPNVTYLSRVHPVGDERVALSNQFFSKTSRNLAENPRASVLLIDPTTYEEYRLELRYERTERRGPVFDRLRADIDTLAALQGLQDVFKLRSADIYRVVDIARVPTARLPVGRGVLRTGPAPARDAAAMAAQLAELSGRLSRCPDLDALVGTSVAALDELLGYRHSVLLLADESGERLYTIATHGYDGESVGSEATVGDGIVGLTAQRCTPMRVGNVRQAGKYSRAVRRSFEEGGVDTGCDLPLPGLAQAESQLAVPALAMGQLVGVLLVEHTEPVAFDETDEALLAVVGSLLAHAIEVQRAQEQAAGDATMGAPAAVGAAPAVGAAAQVRFFPTDGSTFLDGEYLIKGVAGRILWSLLGHHQREGRTEFTNREVRLDPTLELPEFRDNLESRLILLKRRLDEHEAPVRIEKTGRGRFRLVVDAPLRLEEAGA